MGSMLTPFIAASFGEHAAGSSSGRTLNSANDQAAWSIIAVDTKAITTVDIICYSCAGTQANRSLTAAVYSDVNGAVGALLQDGVALTNFTNGKLSLPLSFTKVIGARYHITIRNTAAAPGTDYCSIIYYNTEDPYLAGGGGTGGNKWCFGFSYTANAWTSSTLVTTPCSGMVITHSDGSYFGQILQASAESSFKVYGTRGEGFVYISPANAEQNVRGFWMPGYNAHSATGNQVGKCRFNGTTYTAITIPLGNCGQYADPQLFLFSTLLVIPPGTTCYFFLTNSAVDDASHYFSTGIRPIVNDAAHRGVIPWGGYYCTTTDGTTFTVDNTYRPNTCGVILANSGEFVTPGSPTTGQVLDVASGGPPTWEWGTIGPGTAAKEAHTANQVLKSAGGNWDDDNLGVGSETNVRSGKAYGLTQLGTLIAASTAGLKRVSRFVTAINIHRAWHQ
jgi:hypothetical protein